MNSNDHIFKKIFSQGMSKADLRKKEIIEMTAKLGGEYGLEACTFEFIANKMDLTRPLLNHYFKTREALFDLTAEYVRLTIQEKVVNQLKTNTSADEMLINYIKINLNWIRDNPEHLKYWLQFMITSTHNKENREKNTSYVEIGQQRISEIINVGIKNKKMKVLVGDSLSAARAIQFLITGFLLSFLTENHTNAEQTKEEENIILLSCKMLGIDFSKISN